MTTAALFDRVAALTASLKQTTLLIQQLSTLQPSSTLLESSQATTAAEPADIDEIRVDLGAEIGDALNQYETDLELLKLDVDDVALPAHSSRRSAAAGRIQEVSRLNAGCTRLEEDLKAARIRYRNAQLRAKRNVELAKEKERENYLANLRAAAAAASSPPETAKNQPEQDQQQPAMSLAQLQSSLFRRNPIKSNTQSNSTQSDILLTATSDVTASLKRTHALLTSELSRSRYAHDTLTTSNEALKELRERYGGLDDLLQRSRALLGTLLRSQKSDTWFLQTAVYMLLATLAWLVFRRFLYGPAWWLVWQPVRLLWAYLLAPILGTVVASSSSSTVTTMRAPLHADSGSTPLVHNARAVSDDDRQDTRRAAAAGDSLSEAIGTMLDASRAATAVAAQGTVPPSGNSGNGQEQAQGGNQEQRPGQQQQQGAGEGVRRADGQPLPPRDEAAQPRNPKKRAMEVPPEEMDEQQQRHNEL